MLAYIAIPLVRQSIDAFKDMVWNNHKIRRQRKTWLPDANINHLYSFPERYGLKTCGKYQL